MHSYCLDIEEFNAILPACRYKGIVTPLCIYAKEEDIICEHGVWTGLIYVGWACLCVDTFVTSFANCTNHFVPYFCMMVMLPFQ
jgi:hypothetical protein